ncbi:MAG: dimethylmenaquinone methyltransferase [Planctomycetaceae bacterium]|nr:dimethylmenaquinone methyltransferase [Planctomycetaceae bacterium]
MNFSLKEMRQSLFTAVVCDALDELGYRNQAPNLQLPCFTGVQELLVGRSKTTQWEDMDYEVPNPYELELKAVDECQEDHVFVASTGNSIRSAIWGELLTTAAINRGCVGAIIDGAVRDIHKISKMNFPVYAQGSSPYDSQNRQHVIAIDTQVEIGGVPIQSGDLIFADQDGIVVVPQEIEAQAIKAAFAKVSGENRTRDAIRDGMSATEAYERYGIL